MTNKIRAWGVLLAALAPHQNRTLGPFWASGFRIWGFGFWVWGLGFGGLGCRVTWGKINIEALLIRIKALGYIVVYFGFGVSDLGLRALGSGSGVSDLELRV